MYEDSANIASSPDSINKICAATHPCKCFACQNQQPTHNPFSFPQHCHSFNGDHEIPCPFCKLKRCFKCNGNAVSVCMLWVTFEKEEEEDCRTTCATITVWALHSNWNEIILPSSAPFHEQVCGARTWVMGAVTRLDSLTLESLELHQWARSPYHHCKLLKGQ